MHISWPHCCKISFRVIATHGMECLYCILYLTNVILSSLETPTMSTTAQKTGMMHFNDTAYNEFRCYFFACNNIADRPIVWVGFVNDWISFTTFLFSTSKCNI